MVLTYPRLLFCGVWGLGDTKCPQDDPVSKVLDPALQMLAAVPCKEAREVLYFKPGWGVSPS